MDSQQVTKYRKNNNNNIIIIFLPSVGIFPMEFNIKKMTC